MRRSLRRFHTRRIQKRRVRNMLLTHQPTKDEIGVAKKTACRCSCPMCGNPRRHFGEITRQEKLAILKEKEGLCELKSPFLYLTES